MNRQQLAEAIAVAHELPKAQALRILDTLIGTVVTAVKKDDPVSILGFGTFKKASRAARTGVNPSLGTKIKIPASTIPKFVPGSAFKAAVDPKAAKRKAAKKAK